MVLKETAAGKMDGFASLAMPGGVGRGAATTRIKQKFFASFFQKRSARLPRLRSARA
jgi:hypothetical protein